MPNTPENRVHRIRNAMRKLKLKTCVVCGDAFETDKPNQQTCAEICRDELAERRKAERKAAGLPSSGRGEPSTTAKLKARAEFIDSEVKKGGTLDRAIKLIEKTRPDLVLGPQFGISHFTGTDENKRKIIAALQALAEAGEVVSLASAAVLAGGKPSSVVSIESWMKADANFGKAVRAELAGYVLQLEKSVHRLTVEGLDQAIVGGGEILGTQKVFDGKLLAQRLKQFSPDFHSKNASGGGSTVNVNVGINTGTGMQVGQDERPHALIFLDEAWRLDDLQREQLSAIYARVLQIREGMENMPKLDWSPPDDVKAELQAEDIAYTEVEDSDDESI